MRKLAGVVPEAIGREEVLRAGRAGRVLKQWGQVVGPLLATKSAPEKYDHGTVWIAVSGAEWAQELRMIKGQILSKLRQLSGDPELFAELRFGVRPLPPLAQLDEDGPDRAAAHKEAIKDLSVQEIYERRVKNAQEE